MKNSKLHTTEDKSNEKVTSSNSKSEDTPTPEQSKVSTKKPVAITAKPVLKLVIAAVHDDPVGVKEASLEIAHEFELNGETELAHYIYAQYNLVRTFEVTD